MDSTDLLYHFHDTHKKEHGKDINLTLRPAYKDLLAALKNPERRLPPTFHIAGTNGKGSTSAFLRSILESMGKTVHVTTSPHLIGIHERIRVAGKLVTEDALKETLEEIKEVSNPGDISFFEAVIAASFILFARIPADVAIIEVGLGGRLDATNILPKSIASIITRLSYDHRDYLGNDMGKIAREKAGIMRQSTPCYSAAQPDTDAVTALHQEANDKGTELHMAGIEWNVNIHDDGSFDFVSARKTFNNLPKPALVGAHQVRNAALAIAALDALPFDVPEEAIRKGLTSVDWPGRLQQLTSGALYDRLPDGSELWLDGGHNDSAGVAVAEEIKKWEAPIDLILGMLSTKNVKEFLSPLLPYVRSIRTVRVDGEIPGYEAQDLANQIHKLGHTDIQSCASLPEAVHALNKTASRVLVCGSLYLAGHALKENGTPVS